ncbi:hypothetical protein N482_18125 [Pseudoalteromonas luteoviolacea NCIMB 1942]|uniref:Uncharacterized protein n=1 Tax=Pseudoalteromonas luteoviolacea NCIMB 1942 TaxID=1365253 RepID=A0A166Z8C6_9GAMM|nr:hypothetical protein N482_18125 [Pseudoalteromonas luteoviolacea NCIMB 1942]
MKTPIPLTYKEAQQVGAGNGLGNEPPAKARLINTKQ